MGSLLQMTRIFSLIFLFVRTKIRRLATVLWRTNRESAGVRVSFFEVLRVHCCCPFMFTLVRRYSSSSCSHLIISVANSFKDNSARQAKKFSSTLENKWSLCAIKHLKTMKLYKIWPFISPFWENLAKFGIQSLWPFTFVLGSFEFYSWLSSSGVTAYHNNALML